MQYNEYYPFQSTTQNSWTRVNATKNNFLGNGGTELNATSNFYDLEYRHYDPVLGRMNGVDPMASKYSSLSPYNYSFNQPNMVVDVNGADPNGHYFYGSYFTYDDWIPQRDLGWAQTIDRSDAGGRRFGESLSFGLLSYSAAGMAYASQMRSDAYGLSAQAYGARYGTSMSIPQAMAMQGEYNRWVYSQSYDLQMGVKMQLFKIEQKYKSEIQKLSDVLAKVSTTYTGGGGGPMPDPDQLPSNVIKQLPLLLAKMLLNAPDAVSFAGGAHTGIVVGGVFSVGRIYGLLGGIKGKSIGFSDIGGGFEVGGGADFSVTEYYYVNLVGNGRSLIMEDFAGPRVNISVNLSAVVSAGFGLTVAPVGDGWRSGMYLISKTYSYGIAIDGSPITGSYGKTSVK